jgi:hypothetical protein
MVKIEFSRGRRRGGRQKSPVETRIARRGGVYPLPRAGIKPAPTQGIAHPGPVWAGESKFSPALTVPAGYKKQRLNRSFERGEMSHGKALCALSQE